MLEIGGFLFGRHLKVFLFWSENLFCFCECYIINGSIWSELFLKNIFRAIFRIGSMRFLRNCWILLRTVDTFWIFIQIGTRSGGRMSVLFTAMNSAHLSDIGKQCGRIVGTCDTCELVEYREKLLKMPYKARLYPAVLFLWKLSWRKGILCI